MNVSNQVITDDLITGWDRVYLRNSFPVGIPYDMIPDMYKWQYAAIVISGTILLHSHFINGARFRVVRILTDIAAIATLGQALCVLLSLNNSLSEKEGCYLLNVVGQGFFGLLNQFSDNYAVYVRYLLLNPKFSRFLRVLTFIYVLGFLYSTWWPFSTFAPWFVNVNDPAKLNDIKILNKLWYYSYISYDCFFTVLVLLEIYRPHIKQSLTLFRRDNKMYVVAFKAILHNIFSIGGVYAYINYSYYGTTILDLAVCFSLHINWKFEKYFLRIRSQPTQAALSHTFKISFAGSSFSKMNIFKSPAANNEYSLRNMMKIHNAG